MAYALLGESIPAAREGSTAVSSLSIADDAFTGAEHLRDLVLIYTLIGATDLAIQELETALSVPSPLSRGELELDPLFEPLRSHPRFQALMEKMDFIRHFLIYAVVMAVLAASILSFFVGGTFMWESDLLGANLAPSSDLPFWVIFAIFFPAVTGFTQGVSMSGDLRAAGKSLPRGTFAAVGISMLVYLSAIVIAAAINALAEELKFRSVPLARLEAAVAADEQLPEPGESVQGEDDEPAVSLAHRALPLIELLRAAAKAKCNLMWDGN